MKISLVLALATLFAFQAFGMKLKCDPQDGGVDQLMTFKNSQDIVVVKPVSDKLNGLSFLAKYDPTYKANPIKSRYVGEPNGNLRKVLIPDHILEGRVGDYVQIQGNEDGFWSLNYYCSPTD